MTTASSIILKCPCGATLSVPEGVAGARCPKCRTETRVAPAASGPQAADSTCPVCQTFIQGEDRWSRCGACGLVHHTECWTEVGGCGAYGCANAPAKAPDSGPAQANSAWGDTKKCPVCGETIKSIAVKCRYCQTELGTVDPVTSDEYRQLQQTRKTSDSLRNGVAVMFGFSIIGIFAPVMLIIALIVLLVNRKTIKHAGNLTIALAFASAGISAIYSLLMVIFIVAG